MKEEAIHWLRWLTDKVFFWETENKKKGEMLRYVHNLFVDSMLVMIIINFTLYRSYILQTILLGLMILIWLQHILLWTCVVTDVEQQLIEDDKCVVGPWLQFLRLEPTHENTTAIMIVVSTIATGLLLLSWLSRTIHRVMTMYDATTSYLHSTPFLQKIFNTMPQVHVTPVVSVVN